jgi:DNA-binding NarL/FixJ family response regulator
MIAETIKTTNIWILEDHEAFARNIARLLSNEPDLDCSFRFADASQLYDKLAFTRERPDLLLLDLGLPRRDGLEVLHELRTMLPGIRVLVLTSCDDREQIYRAVCNGASGYLLKSASPEEILSSIREVIRGDSALSGQVAKTLLDGFSRHGPVTRIEPLTQREADVLKHLVKGLIKKEIADQLSISQHTVDMHLRAVYRKLNVRSQTEAVSRALRQGLV